MIPWRQFEQGAVYWDLAPRAALHEEYLPYVEQGPSMAEVVFQSPMLELAHERQFVVTQEGGDSAEFQAEHTRRIDDCLTGLNRHFVAHAGDDQFRAETPPPVDHVGLWMLDTHGAGVPVHPVELVISATAPSPTTFRQEHSSQPFELATVSRNQSANSMRSPAASPASKGDRDLSDVSEDQAVQVLLANQFHRSGRLLTGVAARAQKPIRQRRSGPARGVLGSKAYTQLLNTRSSCCHNYESPIYTASHSCYPV